LGKQKPRSLVSGTGWTIYPEKKITDLRVGADHFWETFFH
jgi:hypothetical protein